MPKYYVSCLDMEHVISASDPVEACALVADKTGVITAGLHWRVSELGFNWHTDDDIVDDILIIRWLFKKYGDNRTD